MNRLKLLKYIDYLKMYDNVRLGGDPAFLLHLHCTHRRPPTQKLHTRPHNWQERSWKSSRQVARRVRRWCGLEGEHVFGVKPGRG